MVMALLETPSRLIRRLEAREAVEMPSLPSLPAFDEDAEEDTTDQSKDPSDNDPLQSTPAPSSFQYTARLAALQASGTSSTARFAHSIASRTSRSSNVNSLKSSDNCDLSFNEISAIPSVPRAYDEPDSDMDFSEDEQADEDLSLSDALKDVSSVSAAIGSKPSTPHSKKGDYSGLSLRSAKMSPLDKMRQIAYQKPLPQLRTPSLTHTTPTPPSSSANSTPRSTLSASLPEDRSHSPLDAASIALPPSQGTSPDHPESFESLASGTSQSLSDRLTSLPARPDQSNSTSPDEREPTFSSEEVATPRSQPSLRSALAASPRSSPGPSVLFTSNLNIAPRPRARFPATPRAPHEGDTTTPFVRRRSFLMDVINSTARPRFAQPTPHPQHTVLSTPVPQCAASEEPSIPLNGSNDARTTRSELEDGTQSSESPAPAPVPLWAAFAGVTPGPRPRVLRAARPSYPLARTQVPEMVFVDHDAGSEDFVERPSFASTASSHDLAMHPRANASFDPAIGLGGGHGLGRFDAAKLNTYLHGLNRRLQEESESLAGQVSVLRNETVELAEENALLAAEVEELRGQMRRAGRRSSNGRRVSDIALSLRDVTEDVGGEGWMEEKATMEAELETLRADVHRFTVELDEAASLLQEEKDKRAADQYSWESEKKKIEVGVQEIIQDLEAQKDDLERRAEMLPGKEERIKELERALLAAEEGRTFANQRADKVEQMLAKGQDLGAELQHANKQLAHALSDLRTAHIRIEDLELELKRAGECVDNLQIRAQDERDKTRKLEQEIEARESDLNSMEHHVMDREEALQQLERELADARQHIADLEVEGNAVVGRVEALQDDFATERERFSALTACDGEIRQNIARLEEEAERNAELGRQMEDALVAAEEKAVKDEAELSELRLKVFNLERDRSYHGISRNADRILQETSPEIAELESELDDAYKRIGKLEALLAQSPAREALDKAKDARLQMLEKEREELLDRIKSYARNTPKKPANESNISPMHRQVLNLTMRAPKTPGGPLGDLTWLHPSTSSEKSLSDYLAKIRDLQVQLDQANEDIDEKLDRLNNVNFEGVMLRQQLADERAKTLSLEDDLARQARRDERRMRRLEKARCTQCHAKIDLRSLNSTAIDNESSVEVSMLSQDVRSAILPTRSSDMLKAELRAVNKELTLMKKKWQEEKRQLLGDKVVLQDAAKKLNAQMRDAERRANDKERADERELEEARRTIAELDDDLQGERERLRSLTREQSSAERERQAVLLKLKRAESEMEDVQHELERLKLNKKELENELRKQKTRRLEARITENADTIEQLRQERSQLASDYKGLRDRLLEATEHLNKLREEHANSQHSHDERRHALDLRLLDIADLRKQLAEKTETINALETQRDTGPQLQDRAIQALEADLVRVRRSAEALGRDLRAERARHEEDEKKRKDEERKRKAESGTAKRELEEAQRAKKQASTEVRVLRELVGTLENEKKALQGHNGESQITALRAQHKLESKGLIVQINYLKAKFTRENMLRTDLVYQKEYLLVLLARHERGEEKVLAAIARIGFPLPGPSPKEKRKKMKSVVRAVVFLSRARKASDAWRKECEAKPAIKAALEDVRRRRAIVAQPRASERS
ncbi:hypothetical protein K488DRAFT_82325 [Vararia minispora EC-137]|uniref:Uncharacterized protein n=1 Tax=Vararia minispora EC-137 TaxID=1314806 RepID=A0ACB8QWF3_9AGAM|nr:hypothetical protein K488DRAFT_82325 [Vararia minispora EC-137]